MINIQDVYNQDYDSELDLQSISSNDRSDEMNNDEMNNDEMNNELNKNNIVLCELYQKNIHGFTNESDKNINGHYLVISKLNPYNKKHNQEIIELYKQKYLYLNNYHNNLHHSFIRNYNNIITNNKYIQLHIAKCIYLNGDECVAIIKTIWLKLIQRNWKRIYAERKKIEKLRKHPQHIHYWMLHGKWSNECKLPSLNGMLSRLSIS